METSVNDKCRAFTSLEQSKKLAEILPLESADMKWFVPADNEGEFIEEISFISYKSEYHLFDKVTDWDDTPYIPCWSLAALLSILDFPLLTQNKEDEWEVCVLNHKSDGYINVLADNPVDACYKLILKLHELNLL